ncbi:MAG TPA: hypothetical protein GXX29_09955 [Firmicutes bacterium]|nr:hypothetical protein [Bacillota bacterium]
MTGRRLWPVLVLVLVAGAIIIIAISYFYLLPRYRQAISLVDPGHELVTQGTPGWEYHKILAADLDGDGETELVHMLARLAEDPMRPGEYQWDDGQPWQVYIEDGTEITHIYARYVQLGKLLALLTAETSPRLALLEIQGAGVALYTIDYRGPERFRVIRLAELSALRIE